MLTIPLRGEAEAAEVQPERVALELIAQLPPNQHVMILAEVTREMDLTVILIPALIAQFAMIFSLQILLECRFISTLLGRYREAAEQER